MLSDKFSNLVDPGRIRKVIHTAPDGHQTTVPKEWAEYTTHEKAQRIAYHQGCGEGVAMFLLEIEALFAHETASTEYLRRHVLDLTDEKVKALEARIKALEDKTSRMNDWNLPR